MAERVASAATSGWSTGCGAERLNVAGAFPFWCQLGVCVSGIFVLPMFGFRCASELRGGWVKKKDVLLT